MSWSKLSARWPTIDPVLDDYPNLTRVVGGHVAKVGYEYDSEFLFGLDVILDGLGRLLDDR